MAELGYMQVKGKGYLIEEFASTLLNEMEKTKVRIKEVVNALDNIGFKLTTLHFTKGYFHAIYCRGDLEYKYYIEEYMGKYWKIIALLLPFTVISVPFWLWWSQIIGLMLSAPLLVWLNYIWVKNYVGKPELQQVQIALTLAEKLILS